jgi:DhnA family fructose-bisphosphate aldolase class Ia
VTGARLRLGRLFAAESRRALIVAMDHGLNAGRAAGRRGRARDARAGRGAGAATREALDAGARGIVYGRNIWHADDPEAVMRGLRAIVDAGEAVGAGG